MSLTLRSASTTVATTKGAALTHAEMDANWLHGLQSSNHSFAQSGSGATTRTVQAKIRDYATSVKDFGATGDGSTDDTTAIQAAITAVLGTGGSLYFPDGTYNISDELTIPLSTGWMMFGESRLGTIIEQQTDNKRIFRFTAADTHSWTLKTFRLDYANTQAAANTAAIPISFMADSGTPSTGFYNFEIADLHIQRGWYAISGNPSVALTVWGGDIHHIWVASEVTGGPIRLTQSVSTGQPNNKIRSIFTRADACANTLFDLQACHNTEMDNIEIVNATNGVRILGASGNSTISIGQMKVENGTWNTASFAIFDTSTSYVTFGRLQLGGTISIDPGAGSEIRLFNISTGGYLQIDLFQIGSGVTVTTGEFMLLNAASAAIAKIDHIGDTLPSNCYLTNIPSGTASEGLNVESWNRLAANADAGDAATTVTIGSTRKVIRYNTTLGANRAITLPNANADGNMFNGLSYLVVRTGLGDFKLDVQNAAGTAIFSFPPNTTGHAEIMYYRLGTFTWQVIRRHLRPAAYNTAVGNVGTGEDNLITFALPARMLSIDGDGVRITAWGTTANNSNTKEVKLYFGTIAILTTALTVSQAGTWRITATVNRTGSNAQDYSSQLIQGGATTLVDVENGSLTQTDTGSITIKCTGTVTDGGGGVNNDDIVQEGMIVEFLT